MNIKLIFIFLFFIYNLALATVPVKINESKTEEVQDESLNQRSYKALKLQVESLRRRLESEYLKAKRELETSSLESKPIKEDSNL